MLKDVRFGFQHDGCWLQETTERYPTATLVVSSVYSQDDRIHIDLVMHAPDPAIVAAAMRDWSKDKRIHSVSKLHEGPRGTRFHVSYASAGSIYPDILRHTPLSLGAIRMANGTEYYSLVGHAEDVSELLKTLSQEGTLRVESVHNLKEMPIDADAGDRQDWVSQLTEKQAEALALAHALGYYTWPRKLPASELALRLGLSPSTFLEHLRHAESRVLDRVIREMREADPARFEALKARLGSEPVRKPGATKRRG
jgi:predicted DNA binding protein